MSFPARRGSASALTGFTSQAAAAALARQAVRSRRAGRGPRDGREVALFADTFNTYFEPENLWDAVEVLVRLGYRVTVPRADEGPKWHYASVLMMGKPSRGRCAAGARSSRRGWSTRRKREARRLIAALLPLARRGVPIVGLEPSCLFTLQDELQAMGLGRRCGADRRAGAAVRGRSSPRKRRLAASRGRSPGATARCCCTATATRSRSAPLATSARCWRWSTG